MYNSLPVSAEIAGRFLASTVCVFISDWPSDLYCGSWVRFLEKPSDEGAVTIDGSIAKGNSCFGSVAGEVVKKFSEDL